MNERRALGNVGPVVVAGFWQETNTYSPRQTTLADFEAFEMAEGDDVRAIHSGVRSVIGGMLAHLGGRANCALSTGAWPAGPTSAETIDVLLDRFAGSLDPYPDSCGVLLNLHGAMVAEGRPDIELDVLRILRSHFPDVPIVAVLDFHANPSRAFLDLCDAVVAYTTYPHVDMFERGVEAAEVLDELLARQVRGRVWVRKLPLLTSPLAQGTDAQPVQALMTEQRRRRQRFGAFITPGFPYSDVARAGLSVMVNGVLGHDNGCEDAVSALASLAWEARNDFETRAVQPAVAVERARTLSGRVMLADVGDNIGGGSPGDGTTLLAELMTLVDRRSLVVLWDPATVVAAQTVGVGGSFLAHVGGHTDDRHGPTLHQRVTVRSLSEGHYRSDGEWMGGRDFSLGPCAALTCGPVTVLVTSVSTPPFHVEQITSQGLALTEFDILTAKGALAWQDGYGPHVEHSIFVDTPGVTPAFPQDLRRESAFDPGVGGEWIFPDTGPRPPVHLRVEP